MAKESPVKWEQLLQEAVSKPGTINQAYRAFHSYSTGNQLLALWQCHSRGMPVGPISTYSGWQSKARYVKKGEKALTLCMPCSFTKKSTDDNGDEQEDHVNIFVYRNNWFVLSQTEGQDVVVESPPTWDHVKALEARGIEQVDFDHMNGNCQGFAQDRKISVSPIAANPLKTSIHEIAHVILGHTVERMEDGDFTPRNTKEMEAEAVTLIVLDSLDLPGGDDCRGYIQSWYGQQAIGEKEARRIFTASDKILKAGQKGDVK